MLEEFKVLGKILVLVGIVRQVIDLSPYTPLSWNGPLGNPKKREKSTLKQQTYQQLNNCDSII